MSKTTPEERSSIGYGLAQGLVALAIAWVASTVFGAVFDGVARSSNLGPDAQADCRAVCAEQGYPWGYVATSWSRTQCRCVSGLPVEDP